MKIKTYLNDPQLKSALLIEIGKHEAADRLAKGTYGSMNDQFRGCAIGCSLHALNIIQRREDANSYQIDVHARYVQELGIPLWLAHLEDCLFENLPHQEAQMWPRRLLEAIPVGVTISDRVLAHILYWILMDPIFGMRHATENTEVIKVVDRMTRLFADEIANDSRTSAVWAAEAAWAVEAAEAVGAAWAIRAVEAAGAAWAAEAVGAAEAAGAVEKMFYSGLSQKILQLLREVRQNQKA